MGTKTLTRFIYSLIGLAGLGLVLGVSPTNGGTAKFQDLLEAARKEAAQGTTFLVYGLAPREENARKRLVGAFRKRFGLPDFRYEQVMLVQTVSIPRAISEIKAGRSGPDILEPTVHWGLELKNAGVVEPFDWVGVFGQEFPAIQEPADARVYPELKGMMMILYDAPRAFVYNTNLLRVDEIPTFERFGDPKWTRRLVMSAQPTPFDSLALVWGENRTVDTVKRIVNNKPIIERTPPTVNSVVAAGQAPLGFGAIHDVERLKKRGAPVDWKTYGDLVPITAIGLSVPKTARHRNLARLYAAWYVTEGAQILEEMESITRLTREGSELAQLVKKRTPKMQILEPKDEQEMKFHLDMREKLGKLIRIAE